jgi:DNA primase large subunit
VGQGKPCPFNFVLENKMELAKTDYQKERELSNDLTDASLSAANERIERRDAELARLREEMETLRTVSQENALMLDDIRLSLFKLLKDQLGAMVSGEIAEQLKTKETTFDIQDHMEDISEYITYNFDISSFQSEIDEIVSERDITDEVTEIVEDVLRGAKITVG